MTTALSGGGPARRTGLLGVIGALALAFAATGGVGCSKRAGTSKRDRPSVVIVDPDEVGRPRPLGEAEPNDSRAQAQDLLPDRAVEGTIGPTQPAVEGKGQKDHADSDFYRIATKDGPRVLTATLSGVAGLDLALEALGEKGQRLVLVNNAGEGAGEILVNLTVDKGTTFLRVFETKGRSSEGRYRIGFALRPLAEGEEREPNFKAAIATPLKIDEEATGYLGWFTDTDWYRVDLSSVTPDARLAIEFDGVDGVRSQLSVRDGAGSAIQERWGGPGEAIGLPNIAARVGEGVLFVVVRCQRSSNVEARYSLRIQSAVPSGPTEAEPNETPRTATSLQPGVPIAGLLQDPQDRDLYALPVEKPGLVHAQVAPPYGLDVALAVLDESGATVLEVDEGRARETETIPTFAVRPPRALLAVRAAQKHDNASSAPYHLSARFVEEAGWEREPNGTEATATAWPEGRTEMHGHLHPRKDIDFFRLVAAGPQVAIELATVSRAPAALVLLDAAGAKIASSGTADAKGAVHVYANVEAGRELLLRVAASGDTPGPIEYVLRKENP
jgi:hypothetical protein